MKPAMPKLQTSQSYERDFAALSAEEQARAIGQLEEIERYGERSDRARFHHRDEGIRRTVWALVGAGLYTLFRFSIRADVTPAVDVAVYGAIGSWLVAFAVRRGDLVAYNDLGEEIRTAQAYEQERRRQRAVDDE
jgi:hypothetical protein